MAAAPGDLSHTPAGTSDLEKLISVLWRGKTTILLTTAIALALAVLFMLYAPRKYTATTELLIDPTDFHAISNEITPANQQSDAAVLAVESQVRVLTSDNLLAGVVSAQGLDHDPEFVRGSEARQQPALSALGELKRHLSVKRAERTYVVDVSVASETPAKAAQLANAVAQAYLTEQTKVRADAARQVSQSLSSRLKELQDRVRDAEERVETYKAQNNLVDANGELVNDQQLSDLNNQLSNAHARVSQAKARLDQIQAMQKSNVDVGAFAEAVQSPTITALRSQYAEVMRREAEQKISLGERHPAVIEIEAQAQRLQKMIADEINRIALSARADYDSAKANEETLSHNFDALKHASIATNASLVGLRELEREVQANRAVYEAFLVRARETGEQERVDTKNIRVISKADLPLHRTSPPSSLIVGFVALLLGAGCGAGIVLMRAAYRGNRPAPGPNSALRQRLTALGSKLQPARTQIQSIPVLAKLPSVDAPEGWSAVEDSRARFARQIQNIYEAVQADHKGRSGLSVLVVAADDEDDTVAVALTLAAAAAAKQQVLLIDADLQRRTLSTIDAADSGAGLVDVATGRRDLADVIVRDPHTNINLMPFVSPNSRRDRPISDADVRRAFDKTRRFDMVIVAALNSGRDPGGRFFAGLVDHIILVARADKSGPSATAECVASLGANAAKVRGAVLTGAEAA
jgi:uncharacterized protein involved in exopolysaccharide biosynthesis/Mrp family chromosome partitioning ATPase